MNLNRTLQSLKLAALFGGVLGLGFGCVIELEQTEPCPTGDHNKLTDDAGGDTKQTEDGACECSVLYDWCDPNDPENLNCCSDSNADGTSGGPDDDGDEIGDESTGDGDGDGDGTTGDGDGDGTTGDGDGDGDPGTLPPETCPPEEENAYWCTHDEAMGVEGSRFFICTDGMWVENQAVLEEDCAFNGFDFAYGCVDDGTQVIPVCGYGSGEPCNNDDPAFCVDDDQIAYCDASKETWDSCLAFCMETGIEGETFEHGLCDESIPDDVACFCCDSGDEGCPI